MIGEGSILDVGCGDLEVFAPLPAVNYTGSTCQSKPCPSPGSNGQTGPLNRGACYFASSSFDYTISLGQFRFSTS